MQLTNSSSSLDHHNYRINFWSWTVAMSVYSQCPLLPPLLWKTALLFLGLLFSLQLWCDRADRSPFLKLFLWFLPLSSDPLTSSQVLFFKNLKWWCFSQLSPTYPVILQTSGWGHLFLNLWIIRLIDFLSSNFSQTLGKHIQLYPKQVSPPWVSATTSKS